MFNLIPPQYVLLVKIILIALLCLSSAGISWKLAKNEIMEERLEYAKVQLVADKAATEYWANVANEANNKAKEALEKNNKITQRIHTIEKVYEKAPALDSKCVIDSYDKRLLSDAFQLLTKE